MIPVAEPSLKGNELKYVLDCIKSNWVSSSGKYIVEFEKKFAEFCRTKYAISVSNGTAALHLALLAIGIREGDEVILPNLTFISTANAVKQSGGIPIFVDSEEETGNMDPKKIEEKITCKTKAIIPVHLYGHPCDMGNIMKTAKKHKLAVIEDCAEAHGAEFNAKKVGSIGDIGCFSFYGNKIITTGEGGMCVTNNEKLAIRIKHLKNYAMSENKRYWHDEIGFNYRLTNIQAALGLAQLEKINEIIKIKRENAHYYNLLLRDIKGLKLPIEKKGVKNVYWMYSILLEKDSKKNRDWLMRKLKECGIETRPFFYLITKMPPYKSDEIFPVAEKISASGINLPSSPNLTRKNIETISWTIRRLMEAR